MAGHTRTVYHTVHDANGNPRANYTIHFQLTPGAYVPHASLPESVVSVTTNDVGYFEADLETGVSIRVLMYSSFVQQGSTLIFGDKNVLTIVVPHGTVPIDLPTVIALETQADPPPDLAAIASTHIGRRDNPHEVTRSQVGLGNADNTADVDKPVSTATINALALKANTSDLGTAAYTDAADYATAAQGGLADTAVQPADLAPYETTAQLNARDTANRDRSNHTGMQTLATISDVTASATEINYTDGVTSPIQTQIDGKASSSALTAHTGDTANPHTVMASQLTDLDTEVSASPDVAANTAARHTHANKATLDAVTDARLVPSGGKIGQVVTVAPSGPAWQDVPGIVYPVLIVRPGYAYNAGGPISLTVGSDIQVVSGEHGQAWQTTNLAPGTSTRISGAVLAQPLAVGQQTFILRGYFDRAKANQYAVAGNGYNGILMGFLQTYYGGIAGTNSLTTDDGLPIDTWRSVALRIVDGENAVGYSNGVVVQRKVAPTRGSTIEVFSLGNVWTPEMIVNIEAFAVYDVALSQSEIVRISTMPAAWTMANAAAQTYQPASPDQIVVPNANVAAGGGTAKVAPSAGSTTIMSLTAGDMIHTTGKSTGGYTRIYHRTAGECWIASTEIV